jgi:NAD(P)-dependent dehydrogenase (short-subunit alcohol dehydrogenase family)
MRRLAPLGRGTVIFTGASGSLRGRPAFAAFNATKGGLRLLVQSMAREFGPQGIHVAHVIIDGGIEGDRLLSRMPDRPRRRGRRACSKVERSSTTTGTCTPSSAAPGATRSICGPTRRRSSPGAGARACRVIAGRIVRS